MRNRIFLVPLLLCGCSTSISYTKWDGSSAVESTALKFRLPDSTITLAVPSAPATTTPAQTKPQQPVTCPDAVTNATWGTCFNNVVAQAAPAGSGVAASPVWVATPDDSHNMWLTTTAISGTAIQGQDSIYSLVTIKYSNNVGAVITGAGAGAAAGFALGGPYGALVLGLVGGVGAVAPNFLAEKSRLASKTVPAGPPPPSPSLLADYVCANESVDIVDADPATPALQKPSISLPIMIKAADVRPLAPKAELHAVGSPKITQAACWHALPNASYMGAPLPLGGSDTKTVPVRTPQPGDGWLYRVVETDADDPAAPLPGTIKVDSYLPSSGRSDFPYPACRTVTMQVTWWQDLANAIRTPGADGKPAPSWKSFDMTIADPLYVSVAYVKKGGAINFKPDCGANVSMDPDTSSAAILNAIVTQGEANYKAEAAWQSSQKKAK